MLLIYLNFSQPPGLWIPFLIMGRVSGNLRRSSMWEDLIARLTGAAKAINCCNDLPRLVVGSPSLAHFKSRLRVCFQICCSSNRNECWVLVVMQEVSLQPRNPFWLYYPWRAAYLCHASVRNINQAFPPCWTTLWKETTSKDTQQLQASWNGLSSQVQIHLGLQQLPKKGWEGCEPRPSETWVEIFPLLPTLCVALGKSLVLKCVRSWEWVSEYLWETRP